MNKILTTALFLTIVSQLLPVPARAEKSIYGDDDRQELFSASSDIKSLADSVVSLWKSETMKLDPVSGTYSLQTENFGERLNLCPGEKFREQPIGAFCSGSLVGEDLILTAGHCVTSEHKCEHTKFVFGYAVHQQGGEARTQIAQEEVYTCKNIVRSSLTDEPSGTDPSGLGPDYALIRLNRKVTNHKPLPINRDQRLTAGQGMLVIGHPVGLPLKIAGNSSVRDAGPEGYFVTDLDTFGGNSGSPVFNASTRLIEGILVRGDEDFIQTPDGCTTSATYGQDSGRGEDVTKISLLQDSIPALTFKKRTAVRVNELGIRPVNLDNIAAIPTLNPDTIVFD